MISQQTVGVTVGKFMPLHIGHESMIEFGAAMLDQMIVIVSSDNDAIDLHDRYSIIKQKYAGRNITVLKHFDEMGAPKVTDEHGTAVDDGFWNYWIDKFQLLAPDATHFVSSDRYGNKAADKLGIKWLAFDPDRELFDISATRIRDNIFENWKYIAKEFRPKYITSVVVMGAESSGKSTLVKDLGAAWNSPAVPEYGRIMTEIVGDRDWQKKDFYDIVERQHEMNRLAAMNSETGLIFIDTEAYTTYLYCLEYLNATSATLRITAFNESFNMYVLVQPNLPWIDDGTRTMKTQSSRNTFVKCLERYLRMRSPEYQVDLKETDRTKRVDIVSEAISSMISGQSYDFSEKIANLID